MASKTSILDGPDDFKLYYHTNEEGHVWLDAKNSPILLTQPLVGHTQKLQRKVFTPQ